ncbi:hypothetical protein [Kitasatospora sp. NPDC005751]|uniref:hypothetical protein n=1 Tax=Kitasatospora sp. NPDC005751 TaxID=3157064 RepID=UPI0033FAD172
MEMISGTGLGCRPWPEFLDRRPALIVPSAPDRVLRGEDGWAERHTGRALAGPEPSWSAVLTHCHLSVHRPGGLLWFDGEIAAAREWRRAVRSQRSLLLITGPFTSVFEFPAAATAGRLFLLTIPARLEGDLL